MNNKPKVIGVTGPIHAGKSTVSAFFESQGFLKFDADVEAHRFYKTQAGLDLLKVLLGDSVFTGDELDYSRLRLLLANDIKLKNSVQNAVFSFVYDSAKAFIDSHPDERVVLDVPLLVDSKMDKLCDYVVLVTADIKHRESRLLDEGKDAASLLKLNDAYPLEQSRAIANAVLINDNDVEELYKSIIDLKII